MKPLVGSFKINFDAAWKNQKACIGFLLRDHDDFVHGGGMTFQDDVANSNWAETLAIMQSLMWASENNWDNVVFEGDSATIINRFNKKPVDVLTIGHLLSQC